MARGKSNWRARSYQRFTPATRRPAEPVPSIPIEELGRFRRGPQQELRISLEWAEGHPFLMARVFQQEPNGRWSSKTYCSLRLSELAGVIPILQGIQHRHRSGQLQPRTGGPSKAHGPASWPAPMAHVPKTGDFDPRGQQRQNVAPWEAEPASMATLDGAGGFDEFAEAPHPAVVPSEAETQGAHADE